MNTKRADIGVLEGALQRSKTTRKRFLVLVVLAGLSGCTVGTIRHNSSSDLDLDGKHEAFVCESTARRDRFVHAAAGMSVSQENAQKLYDISGAESKDVVTGFAPAPDRIPTVKRAIERVSASDADSAYYVEVDIQNLGGLNQKLGHSEADSVYGNMAKITEKHIRGLQVGECSFRHGGDEFSFVVIGPDVTQGEIETTLAMADQEIRQYIADKGLADIEHPKHPGDPSKAGAGIVFGVSKIGGQNEVNDVFSVADKVVERKKQE